jgi:hypothetical protein
MSSAEAGAVETRQLTQTAATGNPDPASFIAASELDALNPRIAHLLDAATAFED